MKRYGVEKLLDCLERNEQKGVVYHREGFHGDYDDFEDVEELIAFILAGENNCHNAAKRAIINDPLKRLTLMGYNIF